MLKSHQIIWADNCPCESTYSGDYLMKTLPRPLANEVHQLRPLLRFGAEFGYGPRIRDVETAQEAKRTVKAMCFSKPGLTIHEATMLNIGRLEIASFKNGRKTKLGHAFRLYGTAITVSDRYGGNSMDRGGAFRLAIYVFGECAPAGIAQ
jgi:hypothetical protein